jgi:hypothetical protein
MAGMRCGLAWRREQLPCPIRPVVHRLHPVPLRGSDEQGPAVLAAEHAGKAPSVDSDRAEYFAALQQAATSTDARVFANVGDADLIRLGIDANTLMIARLLTSDAHLDAMQAMIPEAQYNVLVGLASGQTPEEVWAEVSQYAPAERVDTSDVVKAMERSPGRVVFVQGNDELEKILEHPFARWRVFLHPAQRRIAYAQRYSGPVQVTGGAGTGKTVTALHRAAFLAGRGRRAAAASR